MMKIININFKQQDNSVNSLTNGSRKISDKEIRNAPVLIIEVKIINLILLLLFLFIYLYNLINKGT
jgi:hypothetical protein